MPGCPGRPALEVRESTAVRSGRQESDCRIDGTSITDPARGDALRRAEPRPGHPRHPPERARACRGGSPGRIAGRGACDGRRSPALYCGPGESVVRTAEIVGKALGLRPRRIDDLRNLDQGLWQGLQIEEIKRRNTKALPPVDRRSHDHLSAPGRDRRGRHGAGQGGAQAPDPPPPGRGHRPGRRRAARPADRLLPPPRPPPPARRATALLRLRADRRSRPTCSSTATLDNPSASTRLCRRPSP